MGNTNNSYIKDFDKIVDFELNGKTLIILDGTDNSGKTTTINELRELYKDSVNFVHFPSDNLVKSFEFKRCINNPNVCNNTEFLKNLMIEIIDTISKLDSDYIIVDRMILSSMVYQGLYDFMNDVIINLYKEVFEKLKIKEIYHINMIGFIQNDDSENDPTKKKIDADITYQTKWNNLLSFIYESNESIFNNIYSFKINKDNIHTVRKNIINIINNIIV
jgi:hypothetical protein